MLLIRRRGWDLQSCLCGCTGGGATGGCGEAGGEEWGLTVACENALMVVLVCVWGEAGGKGEDSQSCL